MCWWSYPANSAAAAAAASQSQQMQQMLAAVAAAAAQPQAQQQVTASPTAATITAAPPKSNSMSASVAAGQSRNTPTPTTYPAQNGVSAASLTAVSIYFNTFMYQLNDHNLFGREEAAALILAFMFDRCLIFCIDRLSGKCLLLSSEE